MGKRRGRSRLNKLVLVLVVVAMMLSVAGCGKQAEDEADVDVSFITTKLEGISELATAKMTMKGIIHVTEGKIPLINKKEFYMIYRATIKAGFDLSKAEVQVTEDAVQITLPEVALLDVAVDENSLEFFDKSDSIFNKEDMEDTAEAISAAKEDVLAQPEIEELKQTAIKQVEALLRGLLEGQIGDRELIINVG